MRTAPTAYLGLGSNRGNRWAYLQKALRGLQALPGFRLLAISAVYESEPVGTVPQGPFLNLVCAGLADAEPECLLQATLALEASLGRVRTGPHPQAHAGHPTEARIEPYTDLKGGPRTVDIDWLLIGDIRLSQPHLTLPHPRMHQRRFVMQPLLELAPELARRWPSRPWEQDPHRVEPWSG